MSGLRETPSPFMQAVFELFRSHAVLTSDRAGTELGLSPRQAGNALGNLGIHGLVQRRTVDGVNTYSLTPSGRRSLGV